MAEVFWRPGGQHVDRGLRAVRWRPDQQQAAAGRPDDYAGSRARDHCGCADLDAVPAVPTPGQDSAAATRGGQCSGGPRGYPGRHPSAALHHARHQRGHAPVPTAASAHPQSAGGGQLRGHQGACWQRLLHQRVEPSPLPGTVGGPGGLQA
ncbi:hypothetical protein HaLaN_29127 [Haematococcus lacustris]|uniref:Uncharacterized protein n=1 Tax=Haematococcus lacustris TaxID=44745 RepID=A0A6A0ABT1_HAELA|nr:hypothetical protein HaLaN_29127 [Haematococcus lacustris]